MRKVISAITLAGLVLVSCSKDETKISVPSKFETGYSSLAEAMDSLGVVPGTTYRYRTYNGYPYVNPVRDSGTVVFSLADTTLSVKRDTSVEVFRFNIPAFDTGADRRIRFYKADGVTPASPFRSVSSYKFVYSADTYLWESGPKYYQYRQDTTKLLGQYDADNSTCVFLFH